jgi:stringent starvation protein A
MTAIKRSVMTLYSNPVDIYSHRVRIVLAEKAMAVEVINVNPAAPPECLVSINPYASVPTLVDRDLVLYHHYVIAEYLDERFPHPPLMLVYPVARAKSRLMVYRIERDWYTLYHQLSGQHQDQVQARSMLVDSLLGLEPVFADSPYFLSDVFTLVDCSIAPLLWRLPQLGIEVPKKYQALHAYMQRVFERPSFQTSLTDAERAMHD